MYGGLHRVARHARNWHSDSTPRRGRTHEQHLPFCELRSTVSAYVAVSTGVHFLTCSAAATNAFSTSMLSCRRLTQAQQQAQQHQTHNNTARPTLALVS